MGAWGEGAGRAGGPRVGAGPLPAGDDFEDLQLVAVLDGGGDGDGGRAAQDDEGVGPLALGAQDVFDGGPRARKLDAPCGFVEPPPESDFGRNPSLPPANA
jgi:hypothetical protein